MTGVQTCALPIWDVAITMVSGRSGLVARTTSGKPRRALLGSLLGSGLPEGARVLAPEQDGLKTAAPRMKGNR